MGHEIKLLRYRKLYARLLRLYPESHYSRFAQSMEQTFGDLCRERMEANSGLLRFILWMYVETSIHIIREGVTTMENKRPLFILLGIAGILLLPFITRAPWTLSDYIIMGILLLGTGAALELVMRIVTKKQHRVALVIAILAALFLTWAELAVGIFGTPFAGS